MKQMEVDPVHAEFLDAIISSGNHLMGLFTQLLEFSNLNTEKSPLINEEVSLRDLLKEVQATTYMEARKKGIDFELRIAEHVPEVIVVDKMRLLRVLINLVNNAVKYTNEGFVKLVVGTLCQEKQIYFDVIDSGLGIAKKDFKKIFEPLTRLVNSHTGRYEGLGLGLSIVDKFVRELGGRIHLQSRKNNGSEFRVIIPLQQTQPVKSASVTEPDSVDEHTF